MHIFNGISEYRELHPVECGIDLPSITTLVSVEYEIKRFGLFGSTYENKFTKYSGC